MPTTRDKLTTECQCMCNSYLDDDYERAAGQGGNLNLWQYKYGETPDLSKLSENETRALVEMACGYAIHVLGRDEEDSDQEGLPTT